ncbi:MAG TPA: SOS response-associated peptidase [Sphingomicrobium sp.]|nr:SOS response-associated peptidase [Sphingomicrobium sp.]
MCNLYTQTKSVDEVARVFSDLQMPLGFPEGAPNLQARDICITDPAPIVRSGDNGPELVVRRWSWPGPGGKPVFNFRSDGRDFPEGRCIAIADGFYEFTAPQDPKAKRKHKWRFSLKGAPLFGIAALCRNDPKVGEAFTLLTTEPSEDVRPYHHRQIALLAPQDFARWLDPAVPSAELLKPLPPGSLEVEQIC